MSQGFENYTALGMMGADPDLRFPEKLGKPVVEFSIAINTKWKDDDGVDREKAEWRNCKAFGKMAETIAEYFHKGDRILITRAVLKAETWIGGDGNKNRDMVVIVKDWRFIEKKV